nr:aldo/keto reductase [Clostridium polyendosporum]
MLTNKYLSGIPEDSRAATAAGFLKADDVTTKNVEKVLLLNEIANSRGQSMAQMALAWVLRENRITSALIGASRVSQIEENVQDLNNLEFSSEELQKIEEILED